MAVVAAVVAAAVAVLHTDLGPLAVAHMAEHNQPAAAEHTGLGRHTAEAAVGAEGTEMLALGIHYIRADHTLPDSSNPEDQQEESHLDGRENQDDLDRPIPELDNSDEIVRRLMKGS